MIMMLSLSIKLAKMKKLSNKDKFNQLNKIMNLISMNKNITN